ncbi:hypothetical protein DKX38_011905 [Salix brachista]|uniref:Uncharacterized protein n=1 Tax=Salix brachista TaxID=2182728 RepID=A0A5N5M089_9ROSI|nr:hypothetical protein DKX38_011905 [Salix brachista]
MDLSKTLPREKELLGFYRQGILKVVNLGHVLECRVDASNIFSKTGHSEITQRHASQKVPDTQVNRKTEPTIEQLYLTGPDMLPDYKNESYVSPCSCFFAGPIDDEEPFCFQKAKDLKQWQQTMDEEMSGLVKNEETWDLVPKPKEVQPASCEWV